MHVDFGCLFDHGLNLETPERVPFRLTQNILHTMGPCGGTDGVFRRVCELTLEQLRHHREPLLNARRRSLNQAYTHQAHTLTRAHTAHSIHAIRAARLSVVCRRPRHLRAGTQHDAP